MGFYLAFTFILWSQLEKWLGFHSDKLFIQPIFSILITIPFFNPILQSFILKKKNDYNNQITFQQSFISSLFITGVFALFLPAALYFH